MFLKDFVSVRSTNSQSSRIPSLKSSQCQIKIRDQELGLVMSFKSYKGSICQIGWARALVLGEDPEVMRPGTSPLCVGGCDAAMCVSPVCPPHQTGEGGGEGKKQGMLFVWPPPPPVTR